MQRGTTDMKPKRKSSRIKNEKPFRSDSAEILAPYALYRCLELKKCHILHSFLKRACVRSVLFNVLYSRSVVPCPVTEIIQSYNESAQGSDFVAGKRPRQNQYQRKLQKFGKILASTLEQIDALFLESKFHSGIKAVIITLGPSLNSPREQYILRFHSWDDSHETVAFESTLKERMEIEIGRRCVRELLQGSLEDAYTAMFSSNSNVNKSTWKVNMAFLISQHALHANGNNLNNDESISGETNVDPIQKLILRRGFCIKAPRKKRKTHRPFVVLDIAPLLPSAQHPQSKGPRFQHTKDDVWMSLRTPIKGFRL